MLRVCVWCQDVQTKFSKAIIATPSCEFNVCVIEHTFLYILLNSCAVMACVLEDDTNPLALIRYKDAILPV